ncbi:hypothetical protein Hamer_G011363, partial [Homarus americanus]
MLPVYGKQQMQRKANKDALEKLSKVHPLPSLILHWPKINSSLIK